MKYEPLTDDARANLGTTIPAWRLRAADGIDRLERIYRAPGHDAAGRFSTLLAELADTSNHHPLIYIQGSDITVTWWTMTQRTVTSADVAMAKKTDLLFASFLKQERIRMDRIWSEDTSLSFIDTGAVFTPRRHEILETFLDLLPADADTAFTFTELAVGSGWLIDGILARFPNARGIGLDYSPAMLDATRQTLDERIERAELHSFDMRDQEWIDDLPNEQLAIVSSLAIHHLDHVAKQVLYRQLIAKLAPSGALLILDVVAPVNESGRRSYARAWDRDVQRQSQEMTESDRLWKHFQDTEWNIFDYPDPGFDIPSPISSHCIWLQQAGFVEIDCFWARSGHALYGGYRPF